MLLKRRHLSWQNIPSNEEPGKMAVLRLFPETGPGPPFYVVNDPRPCKKFTICLTWDQALFSFHFLNKMLAGWAKKVPSFLTYFKTLSIDLVLGIEPQTAPPLPPKQYIFLCANSVAITGWNFVSSSAVFTGLCWFNTLFILRDPSGSLFKFHFSMISYDLRDRFIIVLLFLFYCSMWVKRTTRSVNLNYSD